MSHLIALVFDDPLREREARAALHQMSGEGLLQIEGTLLVRRSLDGKMSVEPEGESDREGLRSGRVLELMAAAVTGRIPCNLGGISAGRQVKRLMDHGVTRTLIAGVKSEVQPGKSALIIASDAEPGRRLDIAKRLQRFGATVMERDVPPDLLERIESETEPRAA